MPEVQRGKDFLFTRQFCVKHALQTLYRSAALLLQRDTLDWLKLRLRMLFAPFLDVLC
jgi:regulation of enolase protein 1 (concanavalin A-like superfamily)